MSSKITLPSFSDFISLIYPKLCIVCQEHLSSDNNQLCLTCQNALPETNFHLTPTDNELIQRFWGRVELEGAYAFYYFSKSGRVQRLIHQIKYKGNHDLGTRLGAMYGEVLKDTSVFQAIDLILPVPLHPKKKIRRGYNQSEMIVKGIAQATNKPWRSDVLIRTVNTTTQTQQKSRAARFENVKDAFQVTNTQILENKHILLIDDVITTGATLEGCMLQLQKVKGLKISIAAIGFADHF